MGTMNSSKYGNRHECPHCGSGEKCWNDDTLHWHDDDDPYRHYYCGVCSKSYIANILTEIGED